MTLAGDALDIRLICVVAGARRSRLRCVQRWLVWAYHSQLPMPGGHAGQSIVMLQRNALYPDMHVGS